MNSESINKYFLIWDRSAIKDINETKPTIIINIIHTIKIMAGIIILGIIKVLAQAIRDFILGLIMEDITEDIMDIMDITGIMEGIMEGITEGIMEMVIMVITDCLPLFDLIKLNLSKIFLKQHF